MHRPPARPAVDPTFKRPPDDRFRRLPFALHRPAYSGNRGFAAAGVACRMRQHQARRGDHRLHPSPCLDDASRFDDGDAACRCRKTVGAAYVRDPKNRDVGLRYASILSMTGKSSQALAVMQQVAIAHPADREVLAAYGKAQAAAGQLDQALATIDRAQTPDHPDWKLYSAQGAVLDQMGRSQEARAKYRLALEAQPNEPSVMSNLGMSYVLSGDLKTAESFMRNAATQPSADSRVRQNLALVVGLQGRFSEAEGIARKELSQQQADANVTYLRSMLSQQNAWSKLAAQDAKPKAASTN